MPTVTTITRHAFLSPGHNCWFCWTTEETRTIVNPGVSHRALEILCYAIDKMAEEGWKVENIFVESSAPVLVMMTKDVPVAE